MCRSKPKPGSAQRRRGQHRHVRQVQEEEDDFTDEELPLHRIGLRKDTQPLKVSMTVDGKSIEMELDTGAAVSLMSEGTFRKLWPKKTLSPTKCRLCSYSKEPIPVAGSIQVNIMYKDQSAKLPLVIVKGEGPTLFGRNWLTEIALDWKEIHWIKNSSLQDILSKHEAVFSRGTRYSQGI